MQIRALLSVFAVLMRVILGATQAEEDSLSGRCYGICDRYPATEFAERKDNPMDILGPDWSAGAKNAKNAQFIRNPHIPIQTRENAIVEYLDYQIPVTQLKRPKGNGDMQAAKRDLNAPPTGGRQI